jgi:hypothetical protein
MSISVRGPEWLCRMPPKKARAWLQVVQSPCVCDPAAVHARWFQFGAWIGRLALFNISIGWGN